jgi:N-acyl-D-amino-acid deacylase
VLADTAAETLRALTTPSGCEKLKSALARIDHPGWDNMAASIGWERIIISSTASGRNAAYIGQSLAQAAKSQNRDPVDFLCELLADESGNVAIIVMSMDQQDVDTVARLPYSLIISDSLYNQAGSPHPRLYGSFPKIIHEYVLKRGILTMETAIHKMTAAPAKRLGLADRGMLAPGAKADIVLLDPQNVRDHATYANPKRHASGISHIIMDGTPVRQPETKIGQVLTSNL